MLSIEDPSCSSKLPVLKTDERASERLALQEADPIDLCERPTPNFSIRDYVFTSRSKGIGTSWPFPQQLLQLCFKHGISDLLPPFEPPELVRAQCGRKQVEPEQPVVHQGATDSIKDHSCSPLHDLVVECSDQGIALDGHAHGDAEISLAVRSHDQTERFSGQIGEAPCSVSVNKSFSEASSELEVAGPAPLPQKLENSREPTEKKCRLIVKLSALSATSRAEDTVSNSSTVSDPMASKICPVCKTFASTSNTTLNAHIDQCLSVESNSKRVLGNFSTPKVKPTKKRLMVDIYKTAPRCTLEDLDRRNGTNWALELALVALTNEASTEAKKLKLLPMDARDEGAVYVDSNGIKLRILSKFSDAPPVMSREESKLRKHAKDIKGSKNIFISKKKRLASKFSKNMKVKAHKKKLGSFKLLKAWIKPASGGSCHPDTYQAKEELNISNACDSSGSATLKHWACSKRSDLKKDSNKESYKTLENPVANTRDPLGESDRPGLGNSTARRSHVLKFSRPSEDLTAASKSKKANFQTNTVHTMEDGKKKPPKSPASNFRWSSENNSLTGGLLLKLPRSKREEEAHMGSAQKSADSSDMTTKPSENCQSLVKDQACSTLEKNAIVRRPSFSLEASKGDLNEKPSASKKFRKHRSLLRTSKREVGSLVRGVHDSIPCSTRANETTKSHQLGSSVRVSRSEIGETVDQVSPSTLVRKGPSTTEELSLDTECHRPGNETRDMQVEVPSFSGDCVSEPTIEKATGDPVTIETPASNARLDPQLSDKECVQSISPGEAHVPVVQRSLDKLEIHCGEMVDSVGLGGLKDSCASQYTECQADTASIQESSACLTSHGDVEPEVHQENSSATSIRVKSNHLANSGEPAESPDSTASTVSLPSPKDFRSKNSESELLLIDAPHQDKVSTAVPSTENSGGTEGRTAGGTHQETKDQPFCCSCRESLSKELQFVRKNVTAETSSPSKGKTISSLCIGPRMSSSFHSYQSPRTNAAATSCLESPTQSNATKMSAESAINFSACSDLGSPSPSSQSQNHLNANPILRLMGKDLLVVNKEEPVQPPTAASGYLTNARCLSPLGFASSKFVVNHDNLQYHLGGGGGGGGSVLGRPPSLGSHQMPHYSPGLQVGGGFAVASMQNGLLDQNNQQKKSYRSLISPAACSLGITDSSPHHQWEKPPSSTQAPHVMQEVIAVDDCPEPGAEPRGSLVSPAGAFPPAFSGPDPMLQRQITYFPSQNQFVPRDVSGGPRPPFPSLYPGVNAHFMKREYLSEGLGPLLPSPFVSQSPTAGLLSPLYYSHTHP